MTYSTVMVKVEHGSYFEYSEDTHSGYVCFAKNQFVAMKKLFSNAYSSMKKFMFLIEMSWNLNLCFDIVVVYLTQPKAWKVDDLLYITDNIT